MLFGHQPAVNSNFIPSLLDKGIWNSNPKSYLSSDNSCSYGENPANIILLAYKRLFSDSKAFNNHVFVLSFFSFVSFAFEGIQGLFLALSFCPSFTMLGIELELAAYGLSALNSICLYHLCIYKWGKDKMSFCHTIKIKL